MKQATQDQIVWLNVARSVDLSAAQRFSERLCVLVNEHDSVAVLFDDDTHKLHRSSLLLNFGFGQARFVEFGFVLDARDRRPVRFREAFRDCGATFSLKAFEVDFGVAAVRVDQNRNDFHFASLL
jgi:hypothetical protein